MKKKLFFLLFLWQLFLIPSKAQTPQKIKFYRLPSGISNNLVSSIIQDKRGFMWFGTSNGLNKFDGYGYKIYEPNPLDTNSIVESTIQCIYEDEQSGLWIGTAGGGVSYFNQKKESFINYRVGNSSKNLSSGAIKMILKDKEGLVWFATENGLNALNPQTGNFEHFTDNNPQTNYRGGISEAVFQDNEENIWACTRLQGLAKFDKKTRKFTYFTKENIGLSENYIRVFAKSKQKNKYWLGYRNEGFSLVSIENGQVKVEKSYKHLENNPNSIAADDVESICEDSRGRLWIGIENDGLSILDIRTETFTNFKHENNDEYSLANDSPWSIYEDKFGNIWIGTFNQGVNIVYNQYYEKFERYSHKSGDKSSLVNNNVSSFLESQDGNIWIGTDGGGISLWNRLENSFTNFTSEDTPPKKITVNAILSIIEDPQQNIWFGTWEGGINVYNPKSKSFSVINKQSHNLYSNTQFTMLKSKEGKVYVGSWESVIELLDLEKKQVMWSRDISKENMNYLNKILEDHQKNLWIGTGRGLAFLPNNAINSNNKLKIFTNANANSLSNVNIGELYEDSKGNIWIGTSSGLNQYNPKTQKFRVYRKNDGLINDEIKGIIEDNLGSLWITTAKGLSKFDLNKETFENFVQEDGLQGNEFSRRAIYKTRKGEILLGGTNGFNLFDPNKLRKNPFTPQIFLTGFKIFNKPVKINQKDSPLKESIEYTSAITLKHTQSVFTIEYVALNYIRPEKNQYAYLLEGFETEWNYVGNKREATYTSLPAGEYTFKVKAANNDGIWNTEAISLKIIVLPPWWETWWFRTLVIGFIVIASFIGFRWRINAIKAQNARLERLVDERTQELQEKNEEVTQQSRALKEMNDEILQQSEELFQQAEELTTQRDYIQGQNMQLAEQNKVMEEKNRQIRQSINAAQTIQQAILPHTEKLDRLLGDYFVLYQPKDVVSGDFYWITQVENQIILVVADCTGHGVPGAFMTLIGNSILDKLVKVLKITNPAEILTQLHHEVFDKLKQGYTGNNNGMDAIVINLSAPSDGCKKIIFAGAKNSLFYLEQGKIQELKGSRRAIGGPQNEDIPFENQEVILKENSIIYVGTDGYIDQNNLKRKKFGQEKFIQLLAQNAHLPLNEQRNIFQKTLEEYSDGTFQRDDILLMGIKV